MQIDVLARSELCGVKLRLMFFCYFYLLVLIVWIWTYGLFVYVEYSMNKELDLYTQDYCKKTTCKKNISFNSLFFSDLL